MPDKKLIGFEALCKSVCKKGCGFGALECPIWNSLENVVDLSDKLQLLEERLKRAEHVTSLYRPLNARPDIDSLR